MASSKNVQALNSRLELACQSRIGEFYRQHVSSLAQLEHQKLDTARMLKSVKKCPSDHEALSIKFLGPAPKSSQRRRGRQQPPDTGPRDTSSNGNHHHHESPQPQPLRRLVTQSARAADREPADQQLLLDQFQHVLLLHQLQQKQQHQQHQQPPLTAAAAAENPFTRPDARSKTFLAAAATPEAGSHHRANGGNDDQADQDGQSRKSGRRRSRRRRRAGTPLPGKLDRFYAQLAATKLGCGLKVVDSTQTDEARRFRCTLSRAEWLSKLAKLDPEYFKNLVDTDSCSSCDEAAAAGGDAEEAASSSGSSGDESETAAGEMKEC